MYDENGELVEGGEGGEGAENGAATGGMGFAAGLMMKAHSLKESVKAKSEGLDLGNVQVGFRQQPSSYAVKALYVDLS